MAKKPIIFMDYASIANIIDFTIFIFLFADKLNLKLIRAL